MTRMSLGAALRERASTPQPRPVARRCAPLSSPEPWGPRAPPEASAHLLWRCPRRCARSCPLRSAPSATARQGTGLTCARERWSGPCTLARGGDEGPCIPRGCRSEGGQTGPKRKAEPLCQGQLLLPDYPGKSERERGSEDHEWAPSRNLPPEAQGQLLPGCFVGFSKAAKSLR